MDGYLVGSFPPPWVEWNDRYRDTMRDFWRGAAPRRPGRRLAARRLVRPVRRRRPVAVRLGELRDRSRRLHPARPGLLQPASTTRPTASRTATAPTTTGPGTTASRARPTTRRSQALRRRQAAEPDGHAVPVQRRTDDHRRRRARPHPARQQQRLLPGQRDLLGRLERRRRVARRATSSPGPRCGCAASTRRCASGTTSPAPRRSAAAPRTWPGSTPRAGR